MTKVNYQNLPVNLAGSFMPVRLRHPPPLRFGATVFAWPQTASKNKNNWPAESKLAARHVVGRCRSVRQLPDYGATVFARPQTASEDWSLGGSLPFCHIRL